MTIIQPHKETNTRYFLMLLFITLLCGSLVYIYEYNKFVDARFEVQKLKESIISYETKSADFKKELYTMLSPTMLQSLAIEQGLVIEKHPEYVTKN